MLPLGESGVRFVRPLQEGVGHDSAVVFAGAGQVLAGGVVDGETGGGGGGDVRADDGVSAAAVFGIAHPLDG
ncbi:hypothetical protein [Streptomyces kebangsaanensis]|uniref:hypothetical protein n=1 Tax=Streptomyces kebangsaanensis TaxID=864058 RepID=UPI000A55807F|nr:hypothetical protein [Streptomyces kebangsaanensis]